MPVPAAAEAALAPLRCVSSASAEAGAMAAEATAALLLPVLRALLDGDAVELSLSSPGADMSAADSSVECAAEETGESCALSRLMKGTRKGTRRASAMRGSMHDMVLMVCNDGRQSCISRICGGCECRIEVHCMEHSVQLFSLVIENGYSHNHSNVHGHDRSSARSDLASPYDFPAVSSSMTSGRGVSHDHHHGGSSSSRNGVGGRGGESNHENNNNNYNGNGNDISNKGEEDNHYSYYGTMRRKKFKSIRLKLREEEFSSLIVEAYFAANDYNNNNNAERASSPQ